MHTAVKQVADGGTADFLGTLVVLNRGNTVIDASRELHDLVAGIVNSNKPGELNIRLKITPSGWKQGGGRVNQVDIDPIISSKIPRHDQGKSIFFVTESNGLTRDDPEQEKLFEGDE
jgi:hypothetical protein